MVHRLSTWQAIDAKLFQRRAVDESGANNLVGKILQDDKTVESYSIQEKDFLVCLPSKV